MSSKNRQTSEEKFMKYDLPKKNVEKTDLIIVKSQEDQNNKYIQEQILNFYNETSIENLENNDLAFWNQLDEIKNELYSLKNEINSLIIDKEFLSNESKTIPKSKEFKTHKVVEKFDVRRKTKEDYFSNFSNSHNKSTIFNNTNNNNDSKYIRSHIQKFSSKFETSLKSNIEGKLIEYDIDLNNKKNRKSESKIKISSSHSPIKRKNLILLKNENKTNPISNFNNYIKKDKPISNTVINIKQIKLDNPATLRKNIIKVSSNNISTLNTSINLNVKTQSSHITKSSDNKRSKSSTKIKSDLRRIEINLTDDSSSETIEETKSFTQNDNLIDNHKNILIYNEQPNLEDEIPKETLE